MYKYFKIVLDYIFAIILTIILLPIYIVICILIKLDSKGPILFRQKRLGVRGKVFEIYKFRTMKVNSEKYGVYSGKDDPRVTKIGSFLRKTSLDEIPQLWNILKGEMSFIGPRPALTYHPWPFEEYTEHQKHMFDVKPGITGYAQVNGRKNVPWPERIEMNVYYVNNMSFLLDLKILVKTFVKVARNEDNFNVNETAHKE